MRTSKWLAAALAAFAMSAVAADASLETARRCVQVKDSLERLVCFDRAFAGMPAAPAAAPAAPAAAPAAPAMAPKVAPVVAAAPVAAPAPPQLGDSSVKRSVKEREAEAGPTSLTAVITELKETRPSVVRMTLDNGNVWQQMEMDSLFYVKVGDTVKIDKGRMGGYRMARVSGNGSGWTRVSRLK